MAEPQGQELKGTPGSRLAPSGTNLLYPGVEEPLRAAANILGLTRRRGPHVDSALTGTGMVGTGRPLKDA